MNETSVTLSPADRERVSGVERLVALGESSVPALLERLIDPSWAVRRAVIAGLASLGDAAVAPMVGELVSDRSSEAKIAALVDALVASTGEVDGPLELLGEDAAAVVADAAAILGRRRSRRAVPTLERWAAHSDDNVAVASMEALASIGAGAGLDAVIRAADSGQFFRVFPAIDVLARSRDPRALEPLSRLLGDPVCSLEAARALGRTGQLSAAPALAAMLGVGSEPLVRAAAVALAEIDDAQLRSYGARDTIVPALRASGDGSGAARRVERCFEGALVEERIALCRVLGWLGADSAAASLVSLLGEDPVVADVAAHALQRLGPVGHRHILSALRHGEGARRALLVPLVPLHFDATADLVACLEDSDPNVRAHACERLGRIGNVSAVPALFARLEDVDAGVVQSATGALHALGSEETKRRALEGVRAPDAKVRRVAVRLIGYFGWADATPVLRDALADPDERVREAAIQALAFVDHPDARVLLLERAASDDPRARAAAMRTLGRVERTDTTTAALLRGLSDPHAWARYYACQSLGRFASPDSLAAILPLLDDAAGHVRVAAIEAVSRFDDVRAIDALLAATRSSDPDASRAAVLGLGATRSPRALAAVLEAAGSSDVATRVVALSALGSFEAPEAEAVLAAAARADNATVRAAAVGILGSRPGLAASARLIALLEDEQLHDLVLAALVQPRVGRLPAILAALETATEPLARWLVTVLTRMGRPEALATLGVALSLDRVEARRAAAAALSAVELPIASSVLDRAARTDADPEVRRLLHFASSRR